MIPQVRPPREIRRSKRLALPVTVHVLGHNVCGEFFHEFTHTLSVNAYGGSLALVARVEKGQSILLVNKSTREDQECRVAHVGSCADGRWIVGIEFAEPLKNFWRIHFPRNVPGQEPNTGA
jgi:hypothetical protein